MDFQVAITQKNSFHDHLVLEETAEGVRLTAQQDSQLSWEDTYRAMAQENESWDDFDVTLLDGLTKI